ncbi:conjugal transfer protein [Streptomyces sp. NPDC056519]|uniref:conjugal transfer protein n=1 Tax=Streptomyces sp. NPDC056519 TaxID=3345849 RepID=UPI0036980AF2
MTTTPQPGQRRLSRPPAAAPVSKPLRSARPEMVPVSRAVSRGPRLARYGIWTALAAGPLALAVALALPRTTIAHAAPAPRATATARTAADPGGVAEMFVDLWLRADAAAPEGNGITAAVRALAPEVDLPKRPRNDSTGSATAEAVAVRTAYGLEGAWTVVVAVLSDRVDTGAAAVPLVRYFAVPGTGGKDGVQFTVTGTPAEVAAPDAAAVPASPFTYPAPSTGVLATTLGEFVRAYLGGGQGTGVERYLSPGLRVSAPRAASYARVDVEDVAADSDAALGTTVPADGTKARVRVRVSGEDGGGVRWPLVYRLEVTARAGRWEISALEAGTTSPPAAKPSAAAPVSGGAR